MISVTELRSTYVSLRQAATQVREAAGEIDALRTQVEAQADDLKQANAAASDFVPGAFLLGALMGAFCMAIILLAGH